MVLEYHGTRVRTRVLYLVPYDGIIIGTGIVVFFNYSQLVILAIIALILIVTTGSYYYVTMV